MAARTRRRTGEARRAPKWVSEALLERLGDALGDGQFADEARRKDGVWPDRLDVLIEHAGGSVPPAELTETLDSLVDRYGSTRVALTMLRSGLPVAMAAPAVERFLDDDALEPLPVEPTSNGSAGNAGGASSTANAVRERDRFADDLRRERERVREKDRKLREERTAHAATRSELTSERDKLRNAVKDLERQLAAGPSGAAIEAADVARREAESELAEANRAAIAAGAETTSARADTRRLEVAVAKARAEVDTLQAELAEVRAAPPSTTDLVRAARHVGAAALLRLEAPGAGDAELLEVVVAVTRWQTALQGGSRRSRATAAPAEPAAPVDPSPPPAPAPAERTRAGRARAAARAIGGPLRVTIVGGGGVGSSAYLAEFAGARILLDCGMGGAGLHGDAPSDLDAVILSHAHGDHMGGLADLLRRQPDLRVYCSKPTKLLATYQANAAEDYIPGDRMLVRDPGETYRILDGAVELTLHRVAHILGSCAIRLRFADDRVVVYSGDLGGAGLRTLRPSDPLPLGGATAVLLESTLGDRGPIRASHETGFLRDLANVVRGGGCAVLPAASVGRAQELAALIGSGLRDGVLPDAPVRMTPLGRRVLDRYRAGDRDGWLADPPYPEVTILRPEEPAAEVVAQPSYVIVGGASALERRSGQLAFAAARRPECGVFFTGYSGANARQRTTGDVFELQDEDGRTQRVEIACRWGWVPSPDHASQRELVRAVAALPRKVPVLLVHGVEDAKRELAEKLRTAGHDDVRLLQDGDVVEF